MIAVVKVCQFVGLVWGIYLLCKTSGQKTLKEYSEYVLRPHSSEYFRIDIWSQGDYQWIPYMKKISMLS